MSLLKKVIQFAWKIKVPFSEVIINYNTQREKMYEREYSKFHEKVDLDALNIIKRYYQIRDRNIKENEENRIAYYSHEGGIDEFGVYNETN